MHYFLIAGEASGDLHASQLILALKKHNPEARFSGMGGKHMQEVGCTLWQDYTQMAFMGIVSVLSNLNKIIRNFHIARQALLHEHPDILILIDYPTFNLQMASFCRRHLPQTKIYYYIPPKIWAWKSWRVHKIGRLCDGIFCIFPFETEFYARYGYKAIYVGNPTVEEVRTFRQSHTILKDTDSPTIALLPGSRRHEIAHCLPTMLKATHRIQGYNIIVTGVEGIERSFYQNIINQYATSTDIRLIFGKTYEIISQAKAAVVNSGTATLETALLHCPQVAVYHITCGTKVLVKLFKPLLFRIPYFTLVNLLAKKEAIRELIAYQFTTKNVEEELIHLLKDSKHRASIFTAYENISNILGNHSAAETTAQYIIRANTPQSESVNTPSHSVRGISDNY